MCEIKVLHESIVNGRPSHERHVVLKVCPLVHVTCPSLFYVCVCDSFLCSISLLLLSVFLSCILNSVLCM